MTAKPQQWAANNRQIATVLGLKIKPAQLKQIGDWRTEWARTGIPKRHAKGYLVIELKEWHVNKLKGDENEKLEKAESRKQKAEDGGQRTEVRSQQSARPPPSALRPPASGLCPPPSDLPPRADAPGEGEELFESDSAGFERTLDLWQEKLNNPEKWEHAPLLSWQMRRLEQQRPDRFEKQKPPAVASGTGWDSGEIPSQVAMANYLQSKYQFPCSEMDISDWLHLKRKPQPDAPAFPQAPTRGRWPNAGTACAWFEQWVVHPAKAATGGGQMNLGDIGLSARAMNAKMQKEIDDAALKSLELQNAVRADDRNYMLRADCRSLVTGTHMAVSGLLTLALERRLPAGFEQLPGVQSLAADVRAALIVQVREQCIALNQSLHHEIPAKLMEMVPP